MEYTQMDPSLLDDIIHRLLNGGKQVQLSYSEVRQLCFISRESFLQEPCLLAYKIKYPDKLLLLRGNHECALQNRLDGFYYECKRRFNARTWKAFTDCFNCMPVAAVVDDKIFCVHGGLSPDLHNLDDIRNIKRPTEVHASGLLCDLLWSDPCKDFRGWVMNTDRGVSYTYGADIVTEFLQKHDLDLICRGHQATYFCRFSC